MKKLFLWIIFITIALFFSMQVSKEIHTKVLFLSDSIKIGILNLNNNIINAITRHFNQAEQIKHLTNELKNKESIQYSFDFLTNQHNELLHSIHSNLDLNLPNFHLVRTISHVNINDYTKIWLEVDHQETITKTKTVIFGLIHNNQVAGIATLSNGRFIGFLNGDEKCSYSVIVGPNKSPGIAKYDPNKGFIIDYIPLYPKIQVGDNIYTSGYDEIFYPNILVGQVESIEERQNYQIATIKLASNQTSQFYWLVDIDNQERSFLQNNSNSQQNSNQK